MENKKITNGDTVGIDQGQILEKVTGGSGSGVVCVYCGVKQGQQSTVSCAKSPVRVHFFQYKPDFKPKEG